eukprot:Selendium_serpulae@DN12221_c0_g1_i1.p1
MGWDNVILSNTGGAVGTAFSLKYWGEPLQLHGNVRIGAGAQTFSCIIGDLMPWISFVFIAISLFKVIGWYANAFVLKHKLAPKVYEKVAVIRHTTHKQPTMHFQHEDHLVGTGVIERLKRYW